MPANTFTAIVQRLHDELHHNTLHIENRLLLRQYPAQNLITNVVGNGTHHSPNARAAVSEHHLAITELLSL